eukprot:GFUD01008340.1.p1 GENE.GFUD01008340.1~~GFUD01008340.1.p1  ORF type:complete len:833 (+),score=293.69 GFUD01008340.1:93-2591(+)
MSCSASLAEPGWETTPSLVPEIQLLVEKQEYEQFLCLPAVQDLCAGWTGDVRTSPSQLLSLLSSTPPQHLPLLQCVGISTLQLFVSVNWLGHPLEKPVTDLLPCLSSLTADDISHLVETVLVRDGDSITSPTCHPELLAMAKMILVETADTFSDSQAQVLWSLRCCTVLATVLEEKSDMLHKEMVGIVEMGLGQDWGWDEQGVMKPLFLLECARYHSMYYRVKEADKLVEMAANLAGLELTDSGALGKRTRYQQRDIAQFCVDLGTGVSRDKVVEVDRELLPRDIKLEDDVRLNKIKFKDDERDLTRQLTGLQQSVLMARFNSKLRALPVDALTSEEVLPYLSPMLDHPQAWSLHCTALLARSRLESDIGRTVERSLAQVENVLENLKLGERKGDRLRLVYSSHLPPVWEVERQLGKLMISLGSTKAALDIYLRLEQWEEVITCYSMLELRHKAAEVIQKRLDEKETPRLWCLLGDATDDLSCYHKALELSGDKNARAWRSLGMHHYTRKEFKECIPLFQKSLDRSSFQPVTLLRLAFSAMELEMWELGAKSYRSYCSFEMDSFEAWNNLCKCYIKLDQKERAWRVLQEALRCDYDNWKVWDNLMVIATDIAVFDDVIRAYNRILDIRQTHIDNQVLSILVRAVLEDLPDRDGQNSSRHRERVQKLLARLTVSMPKEPVPWRLYGDLLTGRQQTSVSSETQQTSVGSETQETSVGSETQQTQEETVRGVQCYQKSLAAQIGPRGWERREETCLEVISLGLVLMDVVRKVEGVQELQLASSIRLSLSSAVKMIEQGQTSVESGLMVEVLGEKVEHLREKLAGLTERITQLRAG